MYERTCEKKQKQTLDVQDFTRYHGTDKQDGGLVIARADQTPKPRPQTRGRGERQDMPKQKKHPEITFKDLRPGEYAVVMGTITWCRLATPISGDELAEKVERQQRAGRMGILDVDHVAISIENAVVIAPRDPQDPNKVAANATIEQKYLDDQLFVTENKPDARWQYSGQRYNVEERCFNGQIPPVFRVGDPAKGENGQRFYQTKLKADLARGTKVALVMRAFAGRNGYNGMGLRAVLIRDTNIQYAGAAGSLGTLKNDLASKLNIDIEIDESLNVGAPVQQTVPAPAPQPAPAPVPVPAPQQVVDMPAPMPPAIDDPGMTGIADDTFGSGIPSGDDLGDPSNLWV